MFTDEQRQYLEEVLGVQVQSIPVASVPDPALATTRAPDPASATIYETLVLTAPLNGEERELLNKILGSVKLTGFHHVEQDSISLAELPAEVQTQVVLAFANYPVGKNQFGHETWYVLPPVNRMLGSGAEVAALKKEAWTLLQQFARERA